MPWLVGSVEPDVADVADLCCLETRRRENLHTPPRAVNRQDVSLKKTDSLAYFGLTTYTDLTAGSLQNIVHGTTRVN